ncbi:MAG TPA: sulfotransferase [Steroidobacteraceae bacterium]|nr:sulfotransferase [Steroidobacteraceae bacterium]
MSLPAPALAGETERLMQSGRLEQALDFARRATRGARICRPEHGLLASILLRLGRIDEAASVVAEAQSLATGSADAYDGLAWVSMALGEHDHSNALYRRATEVAPQDPRFWYNFACSERSLGRLIEAEAACDRAIALDAEQYPTYLLRSELRVQSEVANHLDELRSRLAAAPEDYRARLFLGYALAKELDDIGRFAEAFHWFERAARTRRDRLSYDVGTDIGKLARIAQVYSRELMQPSARAAGAGDSSRFLFVVGLPRSGTTLVERILTGLGGVRSNGETDYFSRALLAAARGEGDVFQRAAAADPRAVAEGFAALAEPGLRAPHILEKLPLNYLYVGAIRRALPEAKILLVSRSPIDSCFAMYRTLFAAGYPFSYDLVELGRYYAAYARLMDHWRAALGPHLHEIVYEELVSEPHRVGAQLAAACGLAWSDAALEVQNNRSVSLTASAAQVRRPIYGSSSGRWRHYREHLQPLIDTLAGEGIACDESMGV